MFKQFKWLHFVVLKLSSQVFPPVLCRHHTGLKTYRPHRMFQNVFSFYSSKYRCLFWWLLLWRSHSVTYLIFQFKKKSLTTQLGSCLLRFFDQLIFDWLFKLKEHILLLCRVDLGHTYNIDADNFLPVATQGTAAKTSNADLHLFFCMKCSTKIKASKTVERIHIIYKYTYISLKGKKMSMMHPDASLEVLVLIVNVMKV